MHDYRRLRVYELALDIADHSYRPAKTFPDSERFELSSQLRRATVSIAASISEGAGRGSNAEFARFLRIARVSAAEADTLVNLAHRFRLVDEHEASDLRSKIEEAKASLTNLERSVVAT